jgi:predicted nucleotidyltransferase component of viral defense system
MFIQMFMMERFMERLFCSPYRDNFILKGGFLISSLAGIENRITKDLDANITGIHIDKDNLKEIINNVINIQRDDGVIFSIYKIDSIREKLSPDDCRVVLNCKLENTRSHFHIDIVNDDKIYPHPIAHEYKMLTNDERIAVKAVNVQSILADKILAILYYGASGGRARDYYDVYLLLKYMGQI